MVPWRLSLNSLLKNALRGRIAALETNSKCSFTPCKLRIFVRFRLALHPLITFFNRLLKRNIIYLG